MRLATHDDAGGVFGSDFTLAALMARAFLRFFATFRARELTSLTRLRCAVAFCCARFTLLLLAISAKYMPPPGFVFERVRNSARRLGNEGSNRVSASAWLQVIWRHD